ncbi:MAG: hypothetical protein QOK46_454, partial [Microbacteriaceae bacterium]|nr:hypothetical protein [Microbacteriaceae bacterium]
MGAGDTSGDLIIRNGTALVGDQLEPVAFATLIVRGGVIIEISGEDVAADGTPEIDADGGFVLPGLIDCHVHFDLAAHPAPYAHWDRAPFIRSITCFHNGLLALRAG